MRLLRYARNDVIARSSGERDEEAIPSVILLYALNQFNPYADFGEMFYG